LLDAVASGSAESREDLFQSLVLRVLEFDDEVFHHKLFRWMLETIGPKIVRVLLSLVCAYAASHPEYCHFGARVCRRPFLSSFHRRICCPSCVATVSVTQR
jgi:hypothetical protein